MSRYTISKKDFIAIAVGAGVGVILVALYFLLNITFTPIILLLSVMWLFLLVGAVFFVYNRLFKPVDVALLAAGVSTPLFAAIAAVILTL